MKKYFRKVMAFVLSVIMCLSMNIPVYAENEANALGVTFKATLDTPTIYTSTEEQTVVMRVTTNKEITLDGMGFTVVWDDALTLKSISGGEQLGEYNSAGTNLANGKAYWVSSDAENVSGITELAVITFTVPAGIQAGNYSVGIEKLEITKDYGEKWEPAQNTASAVAKASTMLTVSEKASGYTANVTSLTSEASVGDSIQVNVGVEHSEDKNFAAGEVVLHYNTNVLEFDKDNSKLGNATVKNENGVITLEDYGQDKKFGTDIYSLSFKTIAVGDASVELKTAAFIDKTAATKSDLISAAISTAKVDINVKKRTYDVTLADIFEGANTVVDGESYTFTVKDGKNYTYSNITATVNGESVNVIDNKNGTYTIQNVTGVLVIQGQRVEKTYNVSVLGNAADDVTDAGEHATYNTDYTFTMPKKEGWAYTLESITIDGQKYTGYSVVGSVCTIPGSAIAGDIVITISKNQTVANVTIEGTGAGAAEGYNQKVDIGADYTLTLNPEAGYVYTVSVTVNGESVSVIDNKDNTYTIKSVTGNVVFYVDKSVAVSGVSVSQYLSLNGNIMWLVKNNTTLAENKVPTYKGEKMFWSDDYGCYCFLVIANTLTKEDAASNIGITDGTATNITDKKDVNCTGKVDASDAQLVYNIYNTQYDTFSTDVTMEKFLQADVNKDGIINVEDAVAIISSILQ